MSASAEVGRTAVAKSSRPEQFCPRYRRTFIAFADQRLETDGGYVDVVNSLAAGYGAVMELGQALLRHARVSDVAMSAIGATLSASWYASERYAKPVPIPGRLRQFMSSRN